MIPSTYIPTPEDWWLLQGGKPRVFISPSESALEVVHIYSQEFDTGAADPEEGNLSHYGMVVGTLATRASESLDYPIEIEFANTFVNPPKPRIVRVPAFLLARHHGQACSTRSYREGAKGSGGRYERITDAQELQDYLSNRNQLGWREQRLGVNPDTNGYRLVSLSSY